LVIVSHAEEDEAVVTVLIYCEIRMETHDTELQLQNNEM